MADVISFLDTEKQDKCICLGNSKVDNENNDVTPKEERIEKLGTRKSDNSDSSNNKENIEEHQDNDTKTNANNILLQESGIWVRKWGTRNLIFGIILLIVAVLAVSLSIHHKNEMNKRNETNEMNKTDQSIEMDQINEIEDMNHTRTEIEKILLRFFLILGVDEYQKKALAWIMEDDISLTMASSAGSLSINDERVLLERFVLAVIYFKTYAIWPRPNWLTVESVCKWEGITCIDTETGLQQLDSFEGVWGPCVDLGGCPPPEIGYLTTLKSLRLYLDDFYSFRTELGQLTALTSLSLDGDLLQSRHIPSEIGKLTELKFLQFVTNHGTPTIPTELFELTKLTWLELVGNRVAFGGTIRTELGQLTVLEHLYIHCNYCFRGEGFEGSIPTEIGQMTALTALDLTPSSLTGSVPTEFGQLTAFTSLNLALNYLSGPIPTELGYLTSLSDLNLGDNNLSFTIPTELGQLTYLYELHLNNNNLSGSIPSELALIRGIEGVFYMDLRDNQLTGTVPIELAQKRGVHCRLDGNANLDGYCWASNDFRYLQ